MFFLFLSQIVVLDLFLALPAVIFLSYLVFFSMCSCLPCIFCSTGHYADGGLCAFLMQERLGVPFGTFTIHSPGASKIDALHHCGSAFLSKFNFHDRVAVERLCAEWADVIVTNSKNEHITQYGHFLYQDAVDTGESWRFFVIPPGASNAFDMTVCNAGETETQSTLEAGMLVSFIGFSLAVMILTLTP